MKKIVHIVLWSIGILVSHSITAQTGNAQQELKKGDVLRLTYRFDEALVIFNNLLKKDLDSTTKSDVQREITLCENGKNMLKFTGTPKVIAGKTVPLKEFYARYDISIPGFWALTPGSLLTARDIDKVVPFIHVSSEHPETIYFSSRGADGKTGWDIYVTYRMPNNEWSAPDRLSDAVNTVFDERFPYLTPDGNTLYFSSNGHYGMGGYNLYKSTKNSITGEWSTPENLGFPLSSTANDLLYVPDTDGLFACFASTRNTSGDSVTLYKIALEGTPVKQSLTELTDILEAADLRVTGDKRLETKRQETRDQNINAPLSTVIAQYQQLLKQGEQVKQRVSLGENELDQLRADYSAAGAEQRKVIAVKIELREQTLNQYRQEQQDIAKKTQELEYSMLAQGIAPVAEIQPAQPLPVEAPVPAASFNLQAGKIITLANFVVQQPVAEVPEEKDFTLKTGAVSQIYENETVEGITYRYQVGVYSKKPDAKTFKGYSPVFINETKGKWVCSIGAFRTYAEAQKYTAQFRRNFKNPLLTAYKDNKTIDLKQARLEESRQPAPKSTAVSSDKDMAWQVVLGEYTVIPPGLLKTVQQATSKDITRATVNGKTVYAVGPYPSRSEADKVVQVLQQSGFSEVKTEAVGKK